MILEDARNCSSAVNVPQQWDVSETDEKRAYRFVDASSWTHNVYFPELSLRNLEHPLQLNPVGHVCLLEDGPGRCRLRGMFIDNHLSFRAQRKVCDQNIASTVKKEFGKAEVDAWIVREMD